MRLRDISDLVRDMLESDTRPLFDRQVSHALVQDLADPQIVYRSVAPASRKEAIHPWMAFSFEPFGGLTEPFGAHTGRQWGLLRMHRQSSGLPELLIRVCRNLPAASATIRPDLYVSFSHSPRVETVIKKVGREPGILRFFHKGSLMEAERSTLPAEFCIPGFQQALPDGEPDDGIPGFMDDGKGQSLIFLGDLIFYNQFRTPDRNQARSFLLNCLGVAVAARYVRKIVRESLAEEQTD